MNHPCRITEYAAALDLEEDSFTDALSAISAEQQARRITPAAASAERGELLARHQARLAELRRQYLGDESRGQDRG